MVEDKGIAVIGAGGHAKVVISILQETKQTIAGVYDDDVDLIGHEILGVPVKGTIDSLANESAVKRAIIGIGDNEIRMKIASRFDFEWVTAIHPFSWVHKDVEIGPGSVVCVSAVIQPGARIGSHVIVNTKTSVDHDCKVDDFAHIAQCHVAGAASVGEGAFLGVGTTVIPGVHIGDWAILGAGAVATKDIPVGATAVGVPARVIKKRPAPNFPIEQSAGSVI